MRANTEGLTQRDRDILAMIAEHGGKTFVEVLARTFWIDAKMAEQQARDRINKLKKQYKLLRHAPTGLIKPQNAIALTDFGKRWCLDETEIEAGTLFLSPVTAWHSIYEQIAWYWIMKTGRRVSRTIVKKWSKGHKHTPDLLYFHEEKPVYVEIELNGKSPDRYLDLIKKSRSDGAHAMFYIFENEKRMKQLGRKLPTSDLIYITNIDDLIKSVRETGKIGAVKQSEFMKKLGEKNDD